jgi:hypothetical protein
MQQQAEDTIGPPGHQPKSSESGDAAERYQRWDPVADAAGPDDSDTSAGDAASDDASSADSENAADTAQPDVPAATPYDFAAQTPWYSCDGKALPKEAVVVDGFVQAEQSFGPPVTRQAPINWHLSRHLSRAPIKAGGLCVFLETRSTSPRRGLVDPARRRGMLGKMTLFPSWGRLAPN